MKILLYPVISCLITFNQPVTPEVIYDYKDCKEIEFQVNSVSHWQPLIQKYFREEDVIKVSRIMFCESSGRSKAVGYNTNGTTDVGLMQINDSTYDWISQKLGWYGDRKDPDFNLKMSSWLFYKSGEHHWNSSAKCWKDRND